jgi:hypothetical protein
MEKRSRKNGCGLSSSLALAVLVVAGAVTS